MMKVCPHCGTELPEELNFCLYCMRKLAKEEHAAVPVRRRERVLRRWILAILCASVCIALLLYVIWKNGADEAGGLSAFHPYDGSSISVDFLGMMFSDVIDFLPEPRWEDAFRYYTVVGYDGMDLYVDSETGKIISIHVYYYMLDDLTAYFLRGIDGTSTAADVLDRFGENALQYTPYEDFGGTRSVILEYLFSKSGTALSFSFDAKLNITGFRYHIKTFLFPDNEQAGISEARGRSSPF